MEMFLNELRLWGCEVESAMDRMLNDEEFYLSCLKSVCEDPAFDILKNNIFDRNLTEAFDAAHTLKGVLSNVGLTPMYRLSCEMVEVLRAGVFDNMEDKVFELMEMKNKLVILINNI